MKKTLCLLLVFLMLIVMIGCANEEKSIQKDIINLTKEIDNYLLYFENKHEWVDLSDDFDGLFEKLKKPQYEKVYNEIQSVYGTFYLTLIPDNTTQIEVLKEKNEELKEIIKTLKK